MTSAAESEARAMPPGLVHVSDDAPGICRLRRGRSFIYRQADGRPLRDADHLERIRKLAIPPAYTSVWICTSSRGHLQATGRDARDRKQYLYHTEWRHARDETKFDRMADFGLALPRIRSKVTDDLDAPVGSQVLHQSIIATIVRLLDTTLMRVGNDEYARNNGSFGLTTLRKRHVDIKGSELRLRFRGKSGITHEVTLHDRRITRIVRRCQSLPGQELFQYLDDASDAHGIGSMDVNDYLRVVSGGEFTAKDFRTWHGSVHALQLWSQLGRREKANQTSTIANRMLAEVAKRLGNTVAVCRKSYVHPRVLALLTGEAPAKWLRSKNSPSRSAGLTTGECEFLALLSASA